MNNRNVILVLMIALVLFIAITNVYADDQLNILCSFHPIYIFTQNVAMNVKGTNIECLLPQNVGPHDYSLTPGDMKKIMKADIFVINGLGLEEFLDKAVREGNPKIKVVNTSIGIKPIKVEGAEDNHKDNEAEHKSEHHHGKYNPHVWVSPKSAIIQVRNIEKALEEADAKNAKQYKENSDKYVAKLEAIVKELEKASKAFSNRKIVTFHNALDYLARDFGLQVVDVIEVVPGHQPSAGELAKMIRRIKNFGVAAIFSEPQYPEKVANVLADETKIPVYPLDPVATGDGKPETYEKIMRKNIQILIKALGNQK